MSIIELFKEDAIKKQLNITIGNTTYSNNDLKSENMELTELLCSEKNLRFGCCEVSTFQIRILNTVLPLKGKQIQITITLGDEVVSEYVVGNYKVKSDKPTADRKYRDITAYDAMYDILHAEVSDWYNTIFPNEDSTITLKEFRDSFLAYFGIEQEEVALINDSMTVSKTIEPSKLSGKTVITAICEINGCFGHIGRDGKFKYIFLKEMKEGLYPSDTLYPRDDLYPSDPINSEYISKSHYIRANYEGFTTDRISKLQIRQEEDDIGCIYGEGDNCYIVQDNFLVYGKSTEELQSIAENLYSIISKVWYRPAHVEAKGNPCLEVGDGIRLATKYEIIYTYILQRTLKGIQALRDTYDAEGEKVQSQKVNGLQESILQLKGKTNKLTRTLEETILEMADMEKGLSSRITQNASSITAEVERAIGQEAKLASTISINADNITAEVKRATEAEGSLSSKITQNAEQISLKVSKDSIVSEINQSAEKITIKAEKIDLAGLVEAEELTTKFATVETLNATKASLEEVISVKASIEQLNAVSASVQSLETNKASVTSLNALNATVENLKTEKLSASEFTAETISAMNITVKSANVSGGFDASKITSGQISADRIDVSGIVNSSAFTGQSITVMGVTATTGINTNFINNQSVSWKSVTVMTGNGTTETINYLGY